MSQAATAETPSVTDGIMLHSLIKCGRDGRSYVVQRADDGRWRALVFSGPVDQNWKAKDVSVRSRWYEDRDALARWIRRTTRRRRGS